MTHDLTANQDNRPLAIAVLAKKPILQFLKFKHPGLEQGKLVGSTYKDGSLMQNVQIPEHFCNDLPDYLTTANAVLLLMIKIWLSWEPKSIVKLESLSMIKENESPKIAIRGEKVQKSNKSQPQTA